MTFVKRLRLLAALVGSAAAAAAVGTAVIGDSPGTPAVARPLDPVQTATAAARTKFSQQPTVTYRTAAGETVFAWQVQPALAPAAPRPRDILVMIDTSASQAGTPLDQARSILGAVVQDATPADRIDIWTVNLASDTATRSLTGGFVAPTAEVVKQAQVKLADTVYGAGAVDLPSGLDKAVKAFEQKAGRQQVLLFLGDGESAASPAPLTDAARADLGGKLADKDVTVLAVPLGVKVQAETLHGLAMSTGGAVVRLTDTVADFRTKLQAALAVPVLKVDKVTFGPEGVETFPTRLPPLRGDRPTLVVGKMKTPAQRVTAVVDGRVGPSAVSVTLGDTLAPPSADNYFLAALVNQWQASPAKDAPAMLAADRTLAMASEQYRLFRDEFTVQGVWAVSADRLDHADKLFQAALAIDPQAVDAAAGLKVVAGIRGGKLLPDAVKIGIAQGQHLTRLQDPAPAPQPVPQPLPGGKPADPLPPAPFSPAGPQPPGAPPQPLAPFTPGERDLIAEARNAQLASESQYRILVDETLRRARALLNVDPESALTDLKRQRDNILNADQLSAPFRQRLVLDLESAIRDVELRAGEILRTLAAERERISQVRQRRTELDLQQTLEEQTRARIDAFRQLMNQARFEYAQQEAQVLIQERVSRGQGVPPEAYASYRIGQAATNLRELTELKRLRENNYLLTMLQVEKSFIPYPDEPPVHFPPAAVWRQLTAGRAEKYSNTELGPDAPPSFKRLRAVLEGTSGKRVAVSNLAGLTLDAVLGQLTQQFAEDGVKFVFRLDRYPADKKPGEDRVRAGNDLSGLPLGAFLDNILRDVGMTWIARPEYIEIGPNTSDYSLRYDEKVTRVFDVAELIVGIPNAQSPSALIQNLQFLGQQSTIFGAALQPFAGAAVNPFNVGGLGGIGGGIGGIGGGIGGIGGGIGGIGGGIGGIAGAAGAGQAGLQGGLGGALGGMQGQMGQLGQLGSQFSIQGNDQSALLLQLITSVVAQGEWQTRGVGGLTNQESAALFDPLLAEQQTTEARKLNSLGFYPPARALVIRGSHRYHATTSFNLRTDAAPMGAGGPGLDRKGQFAKAGPGNNNQPPPAVVGAARPDPRVATAALVKASGGKEPEKLWNAVFASAITKPDVVIDAADVLFEMNEFGHAAEALKASLRKGRVNGIWTHDALAVALKQTQATPAEVERASLSAIDLDPTSADCYLRAAKAESELNQPTVALAFCKRAAALEPNSPDAYIDALAYAAKATDVQSDAVEWASTNLLKRDWAAGGADYHAEARDRVQGIAAKLTRAGKADEAARLTATVAAEKSRDLVIQLLYQGDADLDLVVTEPSGSTCSATNRRTTGGGVLLADQLGQAAESRSEVYAAAQAFAGTYTVSVKSVLGKPIGNRARVRVVKHQGTPDERAEVYSLDLTSAKPVTVTLDKGGRTELATVPDATTAAQLATTQSTDGPAAGFTGGFGDTPTTGGLPAVKPTTETRLSGAAEGLPGLRLETKMGADRKSVVMSAKPVFTGPAVDIPVPAINLVPGKGS